MSCFAHRPRTRPRVVSSTTRARPPATRPRRSAPRARGPAAGAASPPRRPRRPACPGCRRRRPPSCRRRARAGRDGARPPRAPSPRPAAARSDRPARRGERRLVDIGVGHGRTMKPAAVSSSARRGDAEASTNWGRVAGPHADYPGARRRRSVALRSTHAVLRPRCARRHCPARVAWPRRLLAQKPDATSPALLPWSQQIAVREGWLTQRHAALLPMMRRHGVAMWIVATEEFHEDPLAAHVAPPRPYVGNRDFFVFVDAGDAGLKRIAVTGYTEESLTAFFEAGEPGAGRRAPEAARGAVRAEDHRPGDRRQPRHDAVAHPRHLHLHRRSHRRGRRGAHRQRPGSHRGVRRHAPARRAAALSHRRGTDRGAHAPRAVARGDPPGPHHRGRRAPLALRRALGARRAHLVPARPARAARRLGRRDARAASWRWRPRHS